MDAPTLDDYRWLVGPAAETYLQQAESLPGNLVTLAKRLRQNLSAARAHLVVELVELRRRAREKFEQARVMFFARQLLEQATEERIARYKARRFPPGHTVADLCCGLGGDLLALAERGPCLAVDRDSVACLLAEANCRRLGRYPVQIHVANVCELAGSLDCSAWHIDPDRRATGRRVSRVELLEPGMDVVADLLSRIPAGAVKLAPATQWHDETSIAVELEWISSRRECRQQVAWLGALAVHPGSRTATVVLADGQAHSFTGEPNREIEVAPPGKFLYDVDASLNASRLAGAYAQSLGLASLGRWPTYLTSDRRAVSPLLSPFEVEAVLPLDVKRLKAVLRQRHVGQLEIKVCGAPVDPTDLRRRLAPHGPASATLLIFGAAGAVQVALTQRCQPVDETATAAQM